jgi:beta-lactamase class A
VVGLVIFLLLPTPAPPVPEAVPTAAGVANDGDAVAIANAEGVPGQATEAPLAPSAPTPDPRVVNEQRLREAVFAPFRPVTGRFGIVVKDLATGQSVRLNDNIPFQAASLYKLPVMYEVFKQRDLDIFSLSEEMTIGADDASMDLGSLPWPIGTRITIGTALDRMVTLSDNSGAYMLAKKVGSPRINDDMDSLGLLSTHVRGDDLKTSAGDMARLLEIIARGEALSSDTSAEMVHLMARQQVRNRIPVMLPPDAVVANKTGNWEQAAHDVAIVYGPRATFVIALLSDGITDVDALYVAMATAARNVYDLVNDPSFESSARPALPRSLVASYQSPVRVPGSGGAAATAPQTRPASVGNSGSGSGASSSSGASTGIGSGAGTTSPAAPVVTPADRARQAPSAASASGGASAPVAAPPKPGSGGPPLPPAPAAAQGSGPTAGQGAAPATGQGAAPKPAEKPAEKPAASAGAPAVKPVLPSIFAIPTPTKTP